MGSQTSRKQRQTVPLISARQIEFAVLVAAAALLLFGFITLLPSTSASATSATLVLAEAPASATVGQVYYNTTDQREYIYNGQEWVPHDASIDTYVLRTNNAVSKTFAAKSLNVAAYGSASGGSGTAASPNNFCLDANSNDLCPDAMHVAHQSVMNDCQGCHNLSGTFDVTKTFFKDSSKRAYIPGGPAPVYTPSGNWSYTPTAAAATCSNIACHSVATGTFDYYSQGGDGEPVLNTVTTGGVSTATASWQTDSTTSCNSCHGNPTRNYPWHSGYHGGSLPGANNCELCHPDAKSNTSNGTIISNVLTIPGMHRNGTVDVLARFTSKCFGCH